MSPDETDRKRAKDSHPRLVWGGGMVMTTNRLVKPLQVDNTVIEIRNTTKFLGDTLDSKFSWNEHIEQKCKKANDNVRCGLIEEDSSSTAATQVCLK